MVRNGENADASASGRRSVTRASITRAGAVSVAACFLIVLALGPVVSVGAASAAKRPGDGSPPAAGHRGGPSAGDHHGGARRSPHAREFNFTIDRIRRCGITCRNVTVSLTNTGDSRRQNVTVETEMYAGKSRVWHGRKRVGTLAPNETVTRNQRVNVGLFDAAKIRNNGGYVTIVTTVDWTNGSVTYRKRRKVTGTTRASVRGRDRLDR